MKGMPLNFTGKRRVPVPASDICEGKWNKASSEPTSVLDTRWSPSPTSTSTLSSSFGSGSVDTAGGAAAASGHQSQKWSSAGEHARVDWPAELVGGGKCGDAMDERENVMIEPSATAAEPQDNAFLRWMMGEMDDSLKLQHCGANAHANGSGGGGGGGGDAVPFIDPVDTGFATDPAAFGFTSGFVHSSSIGGVVPGNTLMGSFPNVSKLIPCSIGGVNGGKNSLFPPSTNLSLPVATQPEVFYFQQPEPPLGEEKPQIYSFPNLVQPNLGFYLPDVPVVPPAKRHQAPLDQLCLLPLPAQPLSLPLLVKQEMQIAHSNKVSFSHYGQELFQKQHQQQAIGFLQHQQHQQQHRPRSRPGSVFGPSSDDAAQLAMVDQLHQAAELAEAGNSVNARAILARLNHHLSSPVGKPLHRAAFYFKESLLNLLGNRNGGPASAASAASPATYSLRDVVLRIGAYKAFCEISPLVQFASLTCNQALLETLNGPSVIHILDFDIGFGGHWASFMLEIAPKIGGAYSLRITAFTSPFSHDPLELALTRENLTNFARSLDIPFEFIAINLDSFDPSLFNMYNSNEVVFANLPVSSHRLFASGSLPSLLRFIKQLSPKLVVSVDHACDRTDLSFSQHFLQGLQFYSLLFDSLDSMNTNTNTLRKVESLLLKPKIESLVASRHRAAEKLPPWRSLFDSAGFIPVPFSNYAETQAECLIKRLNLRGFHVEKQQASLLLLWQRRELVSASVWKC